jgi:hypothetical protein
MSEVRPIHLPGSSALSHVLQRARAVLADWTRDWVNDEECLAALSIESAVADDLRRPGEFEGLRGARGQVWFRRDATDRTNFGLTVLGAGLMPRAAYADDWIEHVANHAWSIRNRILCEALVGAPQSASSSESSASLAILARAGSGAIRLHCEPLGLHAIADSGVWSLVPPAERTATRDQALEPLDRAARHSSLRIEVMLGSVELELPKVMDLRRGDVLRFPARLDQPLTVSCEGTPFARALLGDADGRKSIQFTDQYP